MLQWQREFIAQLRMGVPAEKACRSAAGMSLKDVLDHKETDAEFSNAWDEVADPEAGRGKSVGRQLAGETLEALLWAQCTDEEAAAYFSLEPDEFLSTIEKDPELKRIHKLARKGGQAQLRMTQMNEAAAGNASMAMFLGKQFLGQADKVENTVTIEKKPMDSREMAKRMIFVFRENGIDLNKINDYIDLEPIEVVNGEPIQRSGLQEIEAYPYSEGEETEE